MATNWFSLRVTPVSDDRESDAVSRLRSFMSKYADAYLIAREYGGRLGRLHFQCWATTRLTRKNFQQNVKNAMGDAIGKGNAGYAVNEEDIRCPEALQRYCCKGEARGKLPDIVCAQIVNYNDEYVTRYHESYWDDNEARKKSIKEKRVGMYEALYEFVDTLGRPATREDIARQYIRICKQIDKPIDVYRARPVINLVWAKVAPEAEETLLREILPQYN